MLYRRVPKNGDQLSILGFGCMRLAQKDGAIDEERATRQLRHAIDRGLNYVDTAWPYHAGASEPFVGRALANGYRERVKLATKLPTWLVKSREEMDRYLNLQLERLQTSSIDYYLLHSLGRAEWERMRALGAIEFLESAQASGRIVNAGFSFHGAKDELIDIVDAYPWVFCQVQYNYLDVDHQAGTSGVQYAGSRDVAVMVMQPLRGGMLGIAEPPAPIADLWNQAPTPRKPAAWALWWVWNHPEVVVALSGMSDEAQIEENLAAASEGLAASLTPSELELVARVRAKYLEIMAVGCTGCGYCEPCPKDVVISQCFDAYNHGHMFGNMEQARFIYVLRTAGILTGKKGFASQCEQCGDCLMKCPQGLEIPALLEKVAAAFEGPGLDETQAAIAKMLG